MMAKSHVKFFRSCKQQTRNNPFYDIINEDVIHKFPIQWNIVNENTTCLMLLCALTILRHSRSGQVLNI